MILKIYTKMKKDNLKDTRHWCGKIKEIMTRLKFSNDEIDYAYVVVKNHMRWHFTQMDSLRQLIKHSEKQ